MIINLRFFHAAAVSAVACWCCLSFAHCAADDVAEGLRDAVGDGEGDSGCVRCGGGR